MSRPDLRHLPPETTVCRDPRSPRQHSQNALELLALDGLYQTSARVLRHGIDTALPDGTVVTKCHRRFFKNPALWSQLVDPVSLRPADRHVTPCFGCWAVQLNAHSNKRGSLTTTNDPPRRAVDPEQSLGVFDPLRVSLTIGLPRNTGWTRAPGAEGDPYPRHPGQPGTGSPRDRHRPWLGEDRAGW